MGAGSSCSESTVQETPRLPRAPRPSSARVTPRQSAADQAAVPDRQATGTSEENYLGPWLEVTPGLLQKWTAAQLEWAGRRKHGRGTLEQDGARFEGQFQFDHKSGHGEQRRATGSTYVGQWAGNLPHGKGAENWADGSAFEGSFRSGEKHGWGRLLWGNGSLYEGEFERNDLHGEGTYMWSDGRNFSGQWWRNSVGPLGLMQWPDGREYEGSFSEGLKHGKGEQRWPDGRSYVGQWREGKQHGEGVFRNHKGVTCKGKWEAGNFVKWLEEPVDISGQNISRLQIDANDSGHESETDACCGTGPLPVPKSEPLSPASTQAPQHGS